MWEKELLGLYVSTHPLDDFKNYLKHKTQSIKDFDSKKDGQPITLGGIITGLRKIYTKNNDPMAFVAFETIDGDTELIVFPKSFEKYQELWAVDSVIEIKGKINARDREGRPTDELKVIVDGAKPLRAETARKWLKPKEEKPAPKNDDKTNKEPKYAKLTIKLNSITDNHGLMNIKSILDSAKGDCVVIFEFTKTGQKLKFPTTVGINDELIGRIAEVVGKQNVLVGEPSTSQG